MIYESYARSKRDVLLRVNRLSQELLVIISTFKASCQTPLLVGLVSSCIMDLAELTIKINADTSQQYLMDQRMTMVPQHISDNIDNLLKVFFAEHESAHLPSRPIHLNLIKKLLGSSDNDVWDLYECQDLFQKYFKL